MLYSDEPPSSSSSSTNDDSSTTGSLDTARHGACKGVILWNHTHVGWLVHSVPAWPPAHGFLEEASVPPLPLDHERGALAQARLYFQGGAWRCWWKEGTAAGVWSSMPL